MKFNRIAIVNRGEPAMRLINAVAEYNAEHATDLQTIALYTEPDRSALFVREADEAYDIGPAFFADDEGRRQIGYLNYEVLERALVESGADAAWVGWGFVAEHARFADLCDRLGVVFIGPSAEVMRRLGDKITSKQIAESAAVPVAPWSVEPVETVDEALSHADRLGYPVLIKASAGGGGRGIRKVSAPEDMEGAFASARSEALGAFGDATVFIETMVTGARHIEVQIIGDDAGIVWPVGVRDCTVQRRNQKILEEAPSPALTAAQDAEVKEAAARLGRAAGYRNAGTVEFLYQEDSGRFSFMEVNARLQVEHPITEVTTGVDMVKLQLHVANGGLLEGDPPVTRGHAIEARLNAEDPDRDFAPAPGIIDVLRIPVGPGTRVDTGVEETDAVAPEFDSMIAKIIAHGTDRSEAIARLRRALAQMQVVIRNGATNKAFVQELLVHEDLLRNEIDVQWVDRLVSTGRPEHQRSAGIALLAAAIDAANDRTRRAELEFVTSAARGRPTVDDRLGETIDLRYRGQSYTIHVDRLGPHTYRLAVDGVIADATIEQLGRRGIRLSCAGQTYRVLSAIHGAAHYVEVDGAAHRIDDDEGGVIRASAPAVVVSIAVSPGDRVEVGDRLAVIEAMKMETSIVAEYAGVVRSILVRENVQVAPGTALLIVDPDRDRTTVAAAGRVSFADFAAGESLEPHCPRYLRRLRRMLLGYDVSREALDEMAPHNERLCFTADGGDTAVLEREVLGIFVDNIALFRREPSEEEVQGERRSSEEYLFAYQRNLEARGADLPPRFTEQLQRTLAHYGVEDLEPNERLRQALYRITKSHARMAVQANAVLRVIEDRIEAGAHHEDAAFRVIIERVMAESRGRFRAIHDLASELHYRTYDVPFLERVRAEAYNEAERHLAHLEQHPDAPDRDDHMAALVGCTQPLKPRLSARFESSGMQLQQTMLEVITRRYYRVRELEDFTAAEVDGFAYAGAQYDWEGARIHVYSTHVPFDEMTAGARAMASVLAGVPPEHDVVVDFYIWRPRQDADVEATRDKVIEVISAELGHLALRRIVVAISGPESGMTMAGVINFTLRPDGGGGYTEEVLYRALHPMMAKRLEMWRLDGFDLRRLPTLQDIYLFYAVARDNPRDERLFALAEVRDLTPIRNEEGVAVRLPELERMLHDALGPIRRFQARRPPHKRLTWNRIMLYVWPVLEMEPEEIAGLVDWLAPETEGLGLERVSVRVRIRDEEGEARARLIDISNPSGRGVTFRVRKLGQQPIKPLNEYDQRVARLRQRGLTHPYEVIRLIAPSRTAAGRGFPRGEFVEHDLVAGSLVPVERPRGANTANVVVGLVRNFTDRYPEGMTRVAILGDPTRGMGNLAEPECSRIIAALDLAEEMGVPVEWFAVSAGALISMDSGTENMDWIGRVLRRIVEFTQGGGEINIVVTGINVGAQPYWNAEATMLMHTKGILVMMPESAMVLTGKQALDYSGGVSAEDNQGIGGYERIMGPNGQAQYFARDVADACRILLRHYDHTYVEPGERFPRRATTDDPPERNVERSFHGGEFATVGEVFSEATNPGRKRPFDMRRVMAAAVDRNHRPLERWFGMEDAEIGIVWDAHLGGQPVCMVGFESRPVPRLGFIPADGPERWTSGTLFPRSSKKIARAINAASGNRPLVVLANLSGFDGSPESMRSWQLEYGAEIGRAVVNFVGPIVFVVVSRYHGGAFVVFSNTLNDNMEVAAIEGSKASVIGGAPAAAVVFAREVRQRTEQDDRIVGLRTTATEASSSQRARHRRELEEARSQVQAEKLGEVADEFDGVHTVERALAVGSIDRIIAPHELRPYLIDAINRGMAQELDRIEGRD